MSLAPKEAFPLVLEDSALQSTTEERAALSAPVSTLTSALDRLEDILREETDALRLHAPIDFAEISRRKSRSLLELSRMARALPASLDAATAERVREIRETLQQNHDLLGIHLAAVHEVGSILHGIMREAESDGTYSTSLGYGGSPA